MEKPWLKFYDPQVSPHLEYPPVLLHEMLDETANQFPQQIALYFFGRKMNYGELANLATQFAHALTGIGVKRGDRLGILLPNMPQAVISTFGAWKVGVTVCFFDPLAEEEELKRQLTEAGVGTVVVLDLLLKRVDPIFPQTKVKNFIITGVKDFLPFPSNLFFSLAAKGRGIGVKLAKKPNIYPFKEFIQKMWPDQPPFDREVGQSEEVAVHLYTRGTEGRPKGVLLTHKNLAANLLQISTWMGKYEKGQEIFSSLLPFHQAPGVTLAMNLPIYWAAASVQQPRFDPPEFLSAVKARRPTIFPAHASMVESLVWNPDLAKYKISSIRTYISLGQSLPEEVLQNFEKKTGGRIMECYGLCEASCLTHANPLRGQRKVGSMGIPLPDTDAKIMSPETGERELPAGGTGELVIRGPQVMKGSGDQPEETRRALREGWLHTGDLARMDEDGFFYYVGKMKI